MTSTEKKIAFKIEFSRILSVLADQIYQSPLALLRENTQNAFDAVCMRKGISPAFEPLVEVSVDDQLVVVSDNGIGMTPQEIETNYWYAGRSGKNTEEARAAGVVGTFGIGAMANFGVAEALSVESESAKTGQRTLSSVQKADLSTDTESISVIPMEPTGLPGTTVTAQLAPGSGISIQAAREYLREFVEFVDIPVYFNGDLLSGVSHRAVLPSERHTWIEKLEGVSLAGVVSGDLELLGMASGELRVVLDNVLSVTGRGRPGTVVLLQGRNAIRTLRSGFGLAVVGMGSLYNWGGVTDLPFLKPTAGREALDQSSHQQLQGIVSALDGLVSQVAAKHQESFVNDSFLQWVAATKKFALCGPLEITPRPSGQPQTLANVVQLGGVQYYGGRDEAVIGTHASEDQPLIVLSRRSPRRDCEHGYLLVHGIKEVDATPKVTKEVRQGSQSLAQTGLAIRVARILEEDYFLATDIRYGSITGGLPLLVTGTNIPVMIHLDPASSSVAPLLALYDNNYGAFGAFTKDFVRTAIFPRVSKLVPSSTREGSEAFCSIFGLTENGLNMSLRIKRTLRRFFKNFALVASHSLKHRGD